MRLKDPLPVAGMVTGGTSWAPDKAATKGLGNGRKSVRVTPVAVLDPVAAFVTFKVWVRLKPATTRSGESDLVRDKSTAPGPQVGLIPLGMWLNLKTQTMDSATINTSDTTYFLKKLV